MSGIPERTHHAIHACNGIPHPKAHDQAVALKISVAKVKHPCVLNSTTTTTIIIFQDVKEAKGMPVSFTD